MTCRRSIEVIVDHRSSKPMIVGSHSPKRVIFFQTHHLLDPDPVSARDRRETPRAPRPPGRRDCQGLAGFTTVMYDRISKDLAERVHEGWRRCSNVIEAHDHAPAAGTQSFSVEGMRADLQLLVEAEKANPKP